MSVCLFSYDCFEWRYAARRDTDPAFCQASSVRSSERQKARLSFLFLNCTLSAANEAEIFFFPLFLDFQSNGLFPNGTQILIGLARLKPTLKSQMPSPGLIALLISLCLLERFAHVVAKMRLFFTAYIFRQRAFEYLSGKQSTELKWG